MGPSNAENAGEAEILLVNPWIYDFAAYDLWAKPLGLLYIASVLRECGYRVRLIDCLDRGNGASATRRADSSIRNDKYGGGKYRKEIVPKPSLYRKVPRRYGRYGISDQDFLRALANLCRPKAILVTSGMTYWYPGAFLAIRLLRRRFPKAPVFLGGIYATLCAEHARERSGAHRVISGPGEIAALQAVDQVCGRQSQAPDAGDLDRLPFPAFDLYQGPEYACLLTSRGCPHRCAYCASRLIWGDYRRRSVDNVLAELEWLRRRLGIKNIVFYDDALLVDADEHIKPILQGILHLQLDCWFHTPNGLHARLVDRELADLMFRAGFKTVRLSLDTAGPARQEHLQPKVTRDDLIVAVENLSSAGYRRSEIGVYLLAGLPGQKYDEMQASVDFVTGLGARVKLALYSPIPGTMEWIRAVGEGLQDPASDPLLHNNTIFPGSSAELPAERLEDIKLYVKRWNESLA